MFEHLETQLSTQKRKVDFNTYDISVKEIINMFEEGIIDVAPEYQRHFRWEKERQSSLMESIFLGIPVPSVFMATNTDGSWELIDGVQRISSIINFAGDKSIREKIGLKDPLIINGLDKLSTFNGLTFKELPKSIQLQFLLKPLKVTTLSDKSDVNVRFDLFERLNTGGVKLTNQEIRSCIFRGDFNDFLKELAKNEDFQNVVRLPVAKENDGSREELVLRFFAYFHGYKKFEHSVVGFLNDYMKSANKKFDYNKNTKIFEGVFAELNKALPNGISKTRKTTPISLFEAVSVGAALALKRKGRINTIGVDQWIKSDVLHELTTGATNMRTKVLARIEYCRDNFEG